MFQNDLGPSKAVVEAMTILHASATSHPGAPMVKSNDKNHDFFQLKQFLSLQTVKMYKFLHAILLLLCFKGHLFSQSLLKVVFHA